MPQINGNEEMDTAEKIHMPEISRIPEIDLIKAVCICGMVFIHIYEQMILVGDWYAVQRISSGSFDGIFSGVLEFCGAASSFFVICLGIGIVLSRRSTAPYLAKRGVILLLIGLALAFFTNFLPNLLGLLVLDRTMFFDRGGALGLLSNDVLIFAGLAFFFFALVKKFRIPNIAVLAIALGFLISAYFVPTDCFSDIPALQGLFGWIYWQDWGYSFFSFAQWIIFPVFGYLFGQYLIKQQNYPRFYLRLFLISAAGIVIFISLCMLSGIDITSFYTLQNFSLYRITVLSALWCILFFCLFLPLFYLVSKKISGTKISSVVLKMSRNITPIYCTQWMLIVVVMAFAYDFVPIGYPAYFLISIGVLTASYLIAGKYKEIKAKRCSRRNKPSV